MSAARLEKPRRLVFDLDGTLSDPTVGIWRSINHALAALDYPTIGEHAVAQYIGPPLDDTFRRIAPLAQEDGILALVVKYRERYGEVGYAENVVYAGIPDALEYLAAQGVPMGVCTTKRADFAERILELFDLRRHFEFVSGGDIGVDKQQQLTGLLARGAVDHGSVMIGDRAIDVRAARAAGMRAVGVLWGHGSRQELSDAGPDRILSTPAELRQLVDAL
jgi:phosphoglycolate phosphatase